MLEVGAPASFGSEVLVCTAPRHSGDIELVSSIFAPLLRGSPRERLFYGDDSPAVDQRLDRLLWDQTGILEPFLVFAPAISTALREVKQNH